MLIQVAQAATLAILSGFQYNFNSFLQKLDRAILPGSTHTILKKYHHSHKT